MSKIYPLGLVGEQHVQAAIGTCCVGDRVFVCWEIDNPFDNLALVVHTRSHVRIGYVARESWLRAAIHEQGRGVTATILDLPSGPDGLTDVVLNVSLTDDEVSEVTYAPPPANDEPSLARTLARVAKRFL